MARVINEKTRFDTKDLEAIVKAVAERELDPEQRRRAVVEFLPSRKHLSGRGECPGHKIWVWLPPHADTLPRWELASLIAHEFAHSRGMRGERQMRSDESKYGWGYAAKKHFAWANEFPLRRRAKPPKAPKRVKGGLERDRARLLKLSELINAGEDRIARRAKLNSSDRTRIANYEKEKRRIERRLKKRLEE